MAEGHLLSDIEILARLVDVDNRCVFVSPLVDPTHQLGPSSLDLRLGTELAVTRTLQSTHVDLAEGKELLAEQIRKYFQIQKVGPGQRFVLHPGEFALASTLEFLRLPLDIAGRLEGRSSIGRLGLQVHATAGFVDPGFEGALTFELINSGRLPVRFSPGIRLGQICLYRITPSELGYMEKPDSKYGGRLGVEFSQVDLDPEVRSDI